MAEGREDSCLKESFPQVFPQVFPFPMWEKRLR